MLLGVQGCRGAGKSSALNWEKGGDEFSIHFGVRQNFCLDGNVGEILDGPGL